MGRGRIDLLADGPASRRSPLTIGIRPLSPPRKPYQADTLIGLPLGTHQLLNVGGAPVIAIVGSGLGVPVSGSNGFGANAGLALLTVTPHDTIYSCNSFPATNSAFRVNVKCSNSTSVLNMSKPYGLWFKNFELNEAPHFP